MPLTQNQWGFSVENDNPFAIFPYLQDIARREVGVEKMIDLSRGDPGYGFTPSISGREFFGYLMMLDAFLNSWERRFVPSDAEKIWSDIQDWTQKNFSQAAQLYLQQWQEIFSVFEEAGRAQNIDASRSAVLSAFFYNCVASGGSYLHPAGQPLFRAIVVHFHQKVLSEKIDYQDVVFVHGASHAIGSLFKLFGVEGLGYLKKGDTVMIASPVYSPYNSILQNRGIEIFPFSLDPVTGIPTDETLASLDRFSGECKMIVLIDPNNPTGTSARPEFLQKLADFAQKHDSLVVTDEVYSDFFPLKKSMMDYCPERVLRIHARSKIERSTGLRFGDLVVNKRAQEFLRKKFGVDFINSFINAKAPGGTHGEFFHTTFVPGPVQVFGIFHMILGGTDRQQLLSRTSDSRDRFFRVLELPHQGNMYYSMFDLNAISGCRVSDVPIEEKMIQLARRGVIYIPAYRFFHEKDQSSAVVRTGGDLKNFVRASFVNATPEKIQQAAEITKEYLCGT